MNLANKNPFITICIPTYNRAEKVYLLVKNVLSYRGDEIEVVVLDNQSNDNTKLLLSQIEDTRFRYVLAKHQVNGPINIVNSLLMGNGEFKLLCLDKDNIDMSFISLFFTELSSDDKIIFGRINLNLNKINKRIDFKKGIESILNMSYLSIHPTGMFFKSDFLSKLSCIDRIISENLLFPFYLDVICAEMALLGGSSQINIPIFFTESSLDCKTNKSYTYNSRNLFFHPKNRFNEFICYTINLNSLKINYNDRRLVYEVLLKRCFYNSTIGFKKIMTNSSICEHYGIKARNVNVFELVYYYLRILLLFFLRKDGVRMYEKFFITIVIHYSILKKGLKMIL